MRVVTSIASQRRTDRIECGTNQQLVCSCNVRPGNLKWKVTCRKLRSTDSESSKRFSSPNPTFLNDTSRHAVSASDALELKGAVPDSDTQTRRGLDKMLRPYSRKGAETPPADDGGGFEVTDDDGPASLRLVSEINLEARNLLLSTVARNRLLALAEEPSESIASEGSLPSSLTSSASETTKATMTHAATASSAAAASTASAAAAATASSATAAVAAAVAAPAESKAAPAVSPSPRDLQHQGSSLTSTADSVATCPPLAPGCPPHGAKAVCGKRSSMEDAYAVCPNLFELPIAPVAEEIADWLPPRIATQLDDDGGAAAGEEGGDACRDPSPMAGLQSVASIPLERQDTLPDGIVGSAKPMFTGDVERSTGSASSDATSAQHALHFFAVYDGHGGTEAAQHCAKRLHQHFTEALSGLTSGTGSENDSGTMAAAAAAAVAAADAAGCSPTEVAEGGDGAELAPAPAAPLRAGPRSSEAQAVSSAAAERELCSVSNVSSTVCSSCDSASTQHVHADGEDSSSGARAHAIPPMVNTFRSRGAAMPPGDAAGLLPDGAAPAAAPAAGDVETSDSSCSSTTSSSTSADVGVEYGGSRGGSAGGSSQKLSAALEEALKEAFLRTDAEFGADASAALVGSTAVVALVCQSKMWIANCGDSRAVLCRNGKAIQLTDDHKPEREDEAARVEQAGGQVLYWNGHRVMGVLAMSRAIGDHCLRPYVISDPEISVLTRRDDDQVLLLASDGLWDVMSNQEAATLAVRCLERARKKGASCKAAARVAASVLTKAAIDRGSRDNVTVVVVDLNVCQPAAEGKKPPAGASAVEVTVAGNVKDAAAAGGGGGVLAGHADSLNHALGQTAAELAAAVEAIKLRSGGAGPFKS